MYIEPNPAFSSLSQAFWFPFAAFLAHLSCFPVRKVAGCVADGRFTEYNVVFPSANNELNLLLLIAAALSTFPGPSPFGARMKPGFEPSFLCRNKYTTLAI